jgi:hypothetical protein
VVEVRVSLSPPLGGVGWTVVTGPGAEDPGLEQLRLTARSPRDEIVMGVVL